VELYTNPPWFCNTGNVLLNGYEAPGPPCISTRTPLEKANCKPSRAIRGGVMLEGVKNLDPEAAFTTWSAFTLVLLYTSKKPDTR
jgi:hypothetical protein